MAVDDRGAELVAVIWVFTALAIITVALKLVTRARILHIIGLDDIIILFSLCLLVICTCIFTYDVYPLGMGRHRADIPSGTISDTIRINYIGNPFGIMAYSFPNIAIAVLLERILVPNKLRAIALYALAGLQCTIAAISCVLLFTQCTPTEYLWNPAVKATVHCLDAGTVSNYSYFVGSFTAATDIILGVVPIRAFWDLKMPTRTKVGLCLCMGCTLFAAVCAIVKTTKLNELENLADFSYATVDLIIWAIIEAAIIIMAACMPTLRPFFNKTFTKQEHVSEGAGFFRRLGSLFTSTSNKSDARLVRSGTGSAASRGLKLPSAAPSRWGSGWDVDSGEQSVRDAQAVKHSIGNDSRTAIWRTTEFEMESAPVPHGDGRL